MKEVLQELTQQGTNFAGLLESVSLHKHSTPMSLTISKEYTVHAVGTLQEDVKGRFRDNSSIRTSDINEIVYNVEHNMTIIVTRNSTYLVNGDLLQDYGFILPSIDKQTLSELIIDGDLELPSL